MSNRVLWVLECKGADGAWRADPDGCFVTREQGRHWLRSAFDSDYMAFRLAKYEAVKVDR